MPPPPKPQPSTGTTTPGAGGTPGTASGKPGDIHINFDDPVAALGGVAQLGVLSDLQVARVAAMGIKAGTWLADPHNWVRILEVVGGAALIGIALMIMARPAITSAAGKVASIAGARKIA